jgi:hypothetical protein
MQRALGFGGVGGRRNGSALFLPTTNRNYERRKEPGGDFERTAGCRIPRRVGCRDEPNLSKLRLLASLETGKAWNQRVTNRSDILLNWCSRASERLRAAQSYLSFVALLISFGVVITPLALVFRAIGRDPLRLRKAVRDSYWRPCERNLRGRKEMMQPF